MKCKYVLDPAVYDALEFAALVEGGVGSGELFNNGRAVCAYGLAYLAGVIPYVGNGRVAIARACAQARIEGLLPFLYYDSDEAVWDVRTYMRLGSRDRVTFAAWAEALGVVRG